MKFQVCFLLATIPCETTAFTSLASRTQQKSLSLRSTPGGYNEDLSGGVFFNGPSDFRPDVNSPAPAAFSQIELQGKGEQKQTRSQSRSQSSNTRRSKPNPVNTIPKDIVIIGAGLAGVAAALHISLNSNRQVTIIDREDPFQQMEKTTAGSFAAAGMLAPQSERLPSGPLLDLCLESRDMYTDFVQMIESITSNCGEEAQKYLWNKNVQGCDLEPWEVGYAATGGFLAPAFAGDSVATWAPPAEISGTAKWLDDIQVHEMEPCLHPDVIGGWWFPEDASVDARRLICGMRAACVDRGIQFMWGDSCAAGSLELIGGKCKGVKLADGRILSANSVVVANGSWMRNLLPVPITPHKGQSFSVRMPTDTEPILSRVLFAQDTYIVPKADGRIVVGATVEAGSFDPNVTPSGMMHCMANAMQLVPGLGDLPIEETWAGLRPTTPDKGPILGRTSWDNLFIAGGYWRNGVLLAPKTGQLIGDLVMNNGAPLEDAFDEALLEAFKWDRFTEPGGGKKLAANTRYAASMHPVHKRSSGVGVAAAVGTELGFYSGAGAAAQERKKDRDSLFQEPGISRGEDDAFEKAARQGVSDASAFVYKVEKPKIRKEENVNVNVPVDDDNDDSTATALPFDGFPDALTVGVASEDEHEPKEESDVNSNGADDNLDSVYDRIRKNKAVAAVDVEMGAADNDSRPDPGFRVYHVDKETRKETEIPPYTSPQKFFSQQNNVAEPVQQPKAKAGVEVEAGNGAGSASAAAAVDEKYDDSSDYNEKTYDGYTAIQEANGSSSREEELKAMKIARMANRIKVSEIDESKIGVMPMDDDFTGKSDESEKEDFSAIYSTIKANKEAVFSGLEMQKGEEEERPDPGVRIYSEDKDTRRETVIPLYTSPQALKESQSAIYTDNEPWGE